MPTGLGHAAKGKAAPIGGQATKACSQGQVEAPYGHMALGKHRVLAFGQNGAKSFDEIGGGGGWRRGEGRIEATQG